MKKLGIALGVALGVVFIAPPFVGNIVESKYAEFLDKFAQNPSIDIVESQFSTNWFDGISVIKLKPAGDLAELQSFEIVIKEALNFGPVIYDENGLSFNLATSKASFSFDGDVVDEEIVKVLNEKLSVNSKVTYGFDAVTSFSMKEIVKEQDGNSLRIKPLTGEMTISDEKYVTANIQWQGANFNGPDNVVVINGATITMDQELISGDLYSGTGIMTGDFALKVPEITVKDGANVESFSLSEFEISGNSSIENNLIDLALTYGAKEVKAAEQVFQDANLNIVFKKLDADVMSELNTMLASVPKDGDPELMAAHNQKMMMVATKLLANNPEISVSDLSVVTPEGKIQSDLAVSIDNKVYDPANPMSLLAALKANAKGNGPELFFEKLGMKPMLDMYVDQGLLVKEETDVKFSVQFEEGKLTVNGNQIPL